MRTQIDVTEWLEERQGRFIAIADEIWANPEVALGEFKACNLQAESLEQDGFRITRNVGGMPTAFMAEWGSGSPIIGFLGEYELSYLNYAISMGYPNPYAGQEKPSCTWWTGGNLTATVGAITPFGGLGLLLGWFALGVGAWRAS